jgi:hypothetical protein
VSGHDEDKATSKNGEDDQATSENSGADESSSETPELSEEGKEKVRRMREAYDDDRPTAVMPGTGGTITGTAINEWLDDEGNPKFGKDEGQGEDDGTDKAQHEGEDKPQDEPASA